MEIRKRPKNQKDAEMLTRTLSETAANYEVKGCCRVVRGGNEVAKIDGVSRYHCATIARRMAGTPRWSEASC